MSAEPAAPAASSAPVAAGANGANGTENEVLLRVDDLKMHFPIRRGILQRQVGAVKAVDGVTFEVRKGETLGLVGDPSALHGGNADLRSASAAKSADKCPQCQRLAERPHADGHSGVFVS